MRGQNEATRKGEDGTAVKREEEEELGSRWGAGVLYLSACDALGSPPRSIPCALLPRVHID